MMCKHGLKGLQARACQKCLGTETPPLPPPPPMKKLTEAELDELANGPRYRRTLRSKFALPGSTIRRCECGRQIVAEDKTITRCLKCREKE